MKKTKPVLFAIVCLLIVGLVVVFLNKDPSTLPVHDVPELLVERQESPQKASAAASEVMVSQAPQMDESLAEPSAPEHILVAASLLEQDELVQLLPAWMHEEGVDFYFEKTEVMGRR